MENKETKINELKRYSYIKGYLSMQRNLMFDDENCTDEEYNDLTDRLNKVGKHCKDLRDELVRKFGLSFKEALDIQVNESYKGSRGK